MKKFQILLTVSMTLVSTEVFAVDTSLINEPIGIGMQVDTNSLIFLQYNELSYSSDSNTGQDWYKHQLSDSQSEMVPTLETQPTFQSSVFASADLSTGQLKASSSSNQVVINKNNDVVDNYALSKSQMKDILTFKIANSAFDANGIAKIATSILFEGSITTGESYQASPSGTAQYQIQMDKFDGSGVSGIYSALNESWVSGGIPNVYSSVDNTILSDAISDGSHLFGNVVFYKSNGNSLDGSGYTSYTTSFSASLQTIASGATVSYGNTAGISFDLPSWASLSSQSGVFLTASPVPESETYAMLLAGLGLFWFIARRKVS